MRVLLLSSYERWHGGEVVFSALAEGLARHGHAVSLLCRRGSRLGERFGCGGAATRAGSQTQGEATGEVRLLTARLHGEINPRTHLEVMRALRRARAEVLLTNLRRDLKFGALAARPLRVPHVHRFAELGLLQVPEPDRRLEDLRPLDHASPRRRPRRVQRMLLRSWVQGCIVPSFYSRALLLARFPDARPAAVIHNGTDVGRFRPDAAGGRRWRSVHGLAPSELLVGCVGELDWQRKSQHVLLAAAAKIRAPLKLVFLGRGRDEGALRALAGRLGVSAVFAGFEPEMGAAYNALDLVAHPSRMEGISLALVEAMACGRAVVAVDDTSMPELIRSGRDGLLVPAADPEGMAGALQRLSDDPALRARLGASARERVEREFTVDRMVGAYERALDAARRGRFAEVAAATAYPVVTEATPQVPVPP